MTATRLPLFVPSAMPPPSDDELPGFGGLSTTSGHLPLRAMEVEARVVGLNAVVSLRQRFCNPTLRVAEATYVFPLPARAAVTSFAATLGGRRIVGSLRERQVAREIYDEAIATGHRASIVEEERPEVFTARVGNLAPGEEATVELTVVHRLVIEDAEATFRFPLVVSPRYVAGLPVDGRPVGDGTALDTDVVPDASRVTPPTLLSGCPSPVSLSLSVVIDPADLHLSDLRCSLHALAEGAAAPGSALSSPVRVELVAGTPLDRDFILRVRLAAHDLDTSAVLVPDSEQHLGSGPQLEGDGTFLVTIVPPAAGEAGGHEEPTDVIVVLDRSGSMSGWKIVAARRAAGRLIDALGTADRVGVLGFDNVIECFAPSGKPSATLQLYPATDANRYRATEFLARLEARGGTELDAALTSALAAAAGSGRPAVVVLVTDGQVADEDRLVVTAQGCGHDVRIHCVGIDQAVNGGLLERLSRVGRGHCELVETEDRLDEVLVGLQRRIKAPVISNVSVSGAGLDILPATITPSGTVDGYTGAPVVFTGRYSGSGSIVVRASTTDGAIIEHRLAPRVSREPALAALWGRSRIRDLEDDYAVHGDESIATVLVATSLATGVLCRHTAFVAVDEAELVPMGGGTARIIQPLPLPSGWTAAASPSMAIRALRAAPTAVAPMRAAAPTATAGPMGAAGPMAAPDPMAAAVAPMAITGRSGSAARQLRGIAERFRQAVLGDLAVLELARDLLELLVERARLGQGGDDLDRVIRAFIVALLAGDRPGALRAADELLGVLEAPEHVKPGKAVDGRTGQFWRRRPNVS